MYIQTPYQTKGASTNVQGPLIEHSRRIIEEKEWQHPIPDLPQKPIAIMLVVDRQLWQQPIETDRSPRQQMTVADQKNLSGQ